ncbi:MAG: CapA family protein [Oscillospiraceae bacterium]
MKKNHTAGGRISKGKAIGISFLVLALAVLLFLAAIFMPWGTANSGTSFAAPSTVSSLPLAVSSSEPEPQPQTLSLSFSAVGDNLIHDGIYLQARSRAGGDGYDFSYVYENLSYFFKEYNVSWINQETLVNNELAPSSYPTFSTPGQLGQAAYDAGWRVFALSNNHTYDKGATGIAATRRFWQQMPEDTVVYGLYENDADDSSIVLQEKNGITLAYLAYTEHTNGLPTPQGAEAHVIYTSDTATMERQVRRARELADAVIVTVHWGVEGSHAVTQAQRNLAGQYAAWGADVIIGTHPHVIQPVEWIENPEDGRKVLVAYSLGNFLSAQAAANNMVGLALTYNITQTVEPDGTRQPVSIENVKVYPTVTHYDAAYGNIRDYMYRDYTEELAAQHGVRARYSAFSKQYITELVQQYISSEFLVLE